MCFCPCVSVDTICLKSRIHGGTRYEQRQVAVILERTSLSKLNKSLIKRALFVRQHGVLWVFRG